MKVGERYFTLSSSSIITARKIVEVVKLDESAVWYFYLENREYNDYPFHQSLEHFQEHVVPLTSLLRVLL